MSCINVVICGLRLMLQYYKHDTVDVPTQMIFLMSLSWFIHVILIADALTPAYCTENLLRHLRVCLTFYPSTLHQQRSILEMFYWSLMDVTRFWNNSGDQIEIWDLMTNWCLEAVR